MQQQTKTDSVVHVKEAEAALWALGVRYAPLFAWFSMRIRNKALSANVPTIWFFTREGILFKAAFDAFQYGLGHEALDTRLLHVSRLATFAASLDFPLEISLNRLWSQYSGQTVGELFKSLGVSLESFTSLVEQQGLGPQSPAQTLDLREPRLRQALEDAVHEKKIALNQYLDTSGFPKTGPTLVVDIGWRGTIQDNLAHVRPSVHIHGMYFGLLNRLNKQPGNVLKTALIADLESNQSSIARKRLSNSLPFEMLSNGAGGSVTGYLSGQPVSEAHTGEDRVWSLFTQHVQAGIVQGTQRIAEALRAGDETEQRLEEKALAVWDEILENPSPLFVQALLTLEHNETFGVGTYIKYGAGITWSLLFLSLVSGHARKRLQMESGGLPWKRQLRVNTNVSLALRTWLCVEPLAAVAYKSLRLLKRAIKKVIAL